MIRLLILATVLLVAACASVPLSTVARLSQFNAQDVASVDSDVLRVRVSLLDGFPLDAERSQLSFELVSAGVRHQGIFELEVERKEQRALSTGLLTRPLPGTAYILRLTPGSRQTFDALQSAIRPDRTTDVKLDMRVALLSAPKESTTTPVWVELLFSKKQGWFTLIEAGTLPLDGSVMQTSNRA